MIEGTQLYLVAGTALASGLVGGVLYAFSSFVMAGLKRLPPAQGMAAMQSVNVTAVRPGLMIPFVGTMIAASPWRSRPSPTGETRPRSGCWPEPQPMCSARSL